MMRAAIELVLSGVSYRNAAAEMGVPAATIRLRVVSGGLVRARVPRSGSPFTPDAVVRPALAAVARGARVEEAAAAAGMGVSTLRSRIREHGVVMLRERKQRATALTL